MKQTGLFGQRSFQRRWIHQAGSLRAVLVSGLGLRELYWGYIGAILGLLWDDIGIMEKENANYKHYRGYILSLTLSFK